MPSRILSAACTIHFLPFPWSGGKPSSEIRKTKAVLWRFGISGDNPLILVRIDQSKDIALIKDVLTGYEYLRINHVPIDLVILNEQDVSYAQELQILIVELTSKLKTVLMKAIASPVSLSSKPNRSAGKKWDLLLTVARLVFTPQTGFLLLAFPGYAPEARWPISRSAAEDRLSSGDPVSGNGFYRKNQPALAATCGRSWFGESQCLLWH